ncbi:hypothetical protein SISSUDRAFT_1051000 [Sistotremastrum suecicum HHB10207 ss-3]|uniref:Uncharacterized protein n=1 Tax=Sistotremastrum suecicum HHB10207 ss-3 TaxID=1314776 RepID=A0A166AVK0_9AGAM|nr:hypothetical protein SISSUDRAFT_1051000 [Sistotremastrum suecicum HHB10207 ss-3]
MSFAPPKLPDILDRASAATHRSLLSHLAGNLALYRRRKHFGDAQCPRSASKINAEQDPFEPESVAEATSLLAELQTAEAGSPAKAVVQPNPTLLQRIALPFPLLLDSFSKLFTNTANSDAVEGHPAPSAVTAAQLDSGGNAALPHTFSTAEEPEADHSRSIADRPGRPLPSRLRAVSSSLAGSHLRQGVNFDQGHPQNQWPAVPERKDATGSRTSYPEHVLNVPAPSSSQTPIRAQTNSGAKRALKISPEGLVDSKVKRRRRRRAKRRASFGDTSFSENNGPPSPQHLTSIGVHPSASRSNAELLSKTRDSSAYNPESDWEYGSETDSDVDSERQLGSRSRKHRRK